MKYPSVYIRFEGSKFYPSKLKDRLHFPIKTLAEYGKNSETGRYKGKPSPYGLAVLEILHKKNEKNVYNIIKRHIEELLQNQIHLKESGVEEIVFDIETSRDSSSEISISPELLGSLSLLNAKVEFHTITDEDDFETKIYKLLEKYSSPTNEKLYEIILNRYDYPSLFEAKAYFFIIYLYLSKQYLTDFKIEEKLQEFDKFYSELENE